MRGIIEGKTYNHFQKVGSEVEVIGEIGNFMEVVGDDGMSDTVHKDDIEVDTPDLVVGEGVDVSTTNEFMFHCGYSAEEAMVASAISNHPKFM